VTASTFLATGIIQKMLSPSTTTSYFK